jgi:2-oxo-3-hexenedioate decarboxylase/2-keto-4-pentenoate hydratase
MLTPDRLGEAAAIFVAARRERRPVERLPASCAPRSWDDACAIQEAYASCAGAAVVGYKVGCASAESQRLAGSPGPFPGRVFAEACLASPATLARGDFFLLGVEAEFAFEMGRDLPPRRAPYTREEVAGAVDAVRPAIEVCDTRLADWKTAGIEHIVADNGFHGALVLGKPVRDWRRLDLAAHEAVLRVDGAERGRGTGALVLGHPLDSLAWLAGDLGRRGIALRAGDVVAAGTCTGLHFVEAGQAVRAELGALGAVEIRVRP